MKFTLRVPGARSGILVECGSLARAGRFLHRVAGRPTRTAVICDRNVLPYAKRVTRSLKREGLETSLEPIRLSESTKTAAGLERVWNRLLRCGIDREGCVVVVGGGVTGDLVGFAAATYLRGIRFLNVPTTLLAQVDAAIGGKTGINLRAGKNLAGTFTQPCGVLIDPTVLRTLPEKEFRTGLAEVVKVAVIRDPHLFRRLEGCPPELFRREGKWLSGMIARCVRIKAGIVHRDEREAGLRMILNYGHTVGHALERAWRYRVPHGRAIALGMAIEARVALQRGITTGEFVSRQDGLLQALGLPVRGRLDRRARRAFREALYRDKKTRSGSLQLVLPVCPGRVRFPVPVSEAEIMAGMEGVFRP